MNRNHSHIRLQNPANELEQRALSRTISANNPKGHSFLYLQVNIPQGPGHIPVFTTLVPQVM
jgi:hypothetical protein